MALEDLIGDIYKYNLSLPLLYDQPRRAAYDGYRGYLQAGAGNMAGLGQSALSVYGSLAGQDAEAQRFNSLTPVLSGLLGQFGGGTWNIAPISADRAGGFQSVMGNVYDQARSYDDRMERLFRQDLGSTPQIPTFGEGQAMQPAPQQKQPQAYMDSESQFYTPQAFAMNSQGQQQYGGGQMSYGGQQSYGGGATRRPFNPQRSGGRGGFGY